MGRRDLVRRGIFKAILIFVQDHSPQDHPESPAISAENLRTEEHRTRTGKLGMLVRTGFSSVHVVESRQSSADCPLTFMA